MIDLIEYELCYTSANDAKVWVHRLHQGDERVANVAIACPVADLLNKTVYLLPASNVPGTRNPDALIEGQFWEIKTNYAATGTSIDTAVREAYKQAHHIVIHLTNPIITSVLENALYGRVRKCNSLFTVCILLDRQLFWFTKMDILTQQFRGIIKGKGSPT